MKNRIHKKFMAALLFLSCLAMSAGGCGHEAAEVLPEDVELLDPVGVGESYEAAARRNLYDAKVYSGLICPYTEEYALESDRTFTEYAALPGDTVGKGQTLLSTDTDYLDRQIEELQKKIARNLKEYEEYMKEAGEELKKFQEDENFWGGAVERWAKVRPEEEEPPAEEVPEGDSSVKEPGEEDTPAEEQPEEKLTFEKWNEDNLFYETKYRNALISRQKLETEMNQRTELYQLDVDYDRTLLKRLEEDRDQCTVVSKINGVAANMLLMNWGTRIPADQPVAAVADPKRKMIRCDYILKEEISRAERVYAVIGGTAYDAEYVPAEKDGDSYATFMLPEAAKDTELGDYVAIVVIRQSRMDALTVSKDAVTKNEEGSFVYLLENGERVYTPVRTGMQDGAYVEILSGVEEGDRVLTAKDDAPAVKNTLTLEKGSVSHEFSEQGYLAYPRQEWIGNPVTYGTAYFGELMVNINQPVKKGDVLFTMRVKADDVELIRNEKKLQREQERLAELMKNPEENRKAIEARQETIADLEKLIGEMKEDFAVTEVRAPYDGIVTDLSGELWNQTLEEGSLLQKGQGLVVLSKQDSNYIIVEDENGVLSYGNQAEITYRGADGSERKTQGTVVTLNRASVSAELLGEGYVLIRVSAEDAGEMAGSISNEDGWWSRNLFSVSVTTRRMDHVLLVPRKAVVTYGGTTYVRLKQKDGSVLYQSFVAGGSDSENYWVAEGLTEGMEVCIE